MQLMAHTLGGKVKSATTREYGETLVNIENNSPLFQTFRKYKHIFNEPYRLCRKSP